MSLKLDETKRRLSASLAIYSVLVFLLLLLLLHFLKPGLDPSWHFISEYALGELGWLMSIAFVAWGMSCAFLALAFWKETKNFWGRLGVALLWISAFGMWIATVFETDPLNAPETTNGQLHQLGATLNLIPFAALFIIIHLIRKNEAWRASRNFLIGVTVLVWVGDIGFIVSMMTYFPADGKFGPEVLVGWPSRFMLIGECLWLMLMAKEFINLNKEIK